MVEKLTAGLVGRMIDEKIVNDDEREYYVYALITIIEKAISIGSILLVSIMAHKLMPTLLFLLCFFSLRKRTGGFHLDSYAKCYFGTMGIYLLAMASGAFMAEHPLVLLGMLVLAVCIIELIGTVNHPNMHLDSIEHSNLKRAARVLALLEGGVIGALAWIGADRILVSYMAVGVILCAVLLLLAKIIKQEVKEDGKIE